MSFDMDVGAQYILAREFKTQSIEFACWSTPDPIRLKSVSTIGCCDVLPSLPQEHQISMATDPGEVSSGDTMLAAKRCR